MIRLAANISMMFPELPLLDRIDAAKHAGFTAVECQFPYSVPAKDFTGRIAAHNMDWVLLNTHPGVAERGERGLAGLPGRVADFRKSVELALEYLAAGNCRKIHVMAGIVPSGATREQCEAQFVENLAYAADQFAALNVTALIEPINTRVDVPGYLLDSTAMAMRCIKAANRPNIQMQYDVYHMQIMEGDVTRSIERLLPYIGHIQIADNPGRHEPGSGEINFQNVLGSIDKFGYAGHIGCEYMPMGNTVEGLKWAKQYLGT
jgi:hydroxypyruvate isomerase